jgi:hypothetical protein
MTIDLRIVYAAMGAGIALLVMVLILLMRGGSGGPLDLASVVTWFQRKKTYLAGAALLLVDQIHQVGWMTDNQAQQVEKVVIVVMAFTLKAAVSRVEKATGSATTAAQEAASLAATTQQTVKAAVKIPVTPTSVEIKP